MNNALTTLFITARYGFFHKGNTLYNNQEELFFIETANKVKGAEQSQMFGKPCFKIKKKAFVCFFERCMVFKLSGTMHHKAISIVESKLFDPSGKERPMKEWVQVPFEYKDLWEEFVFAAANYVTENSNV